MSNKTKPYFLYVLVIVLMPFAIGLIFSLTKPEVEPVRIWIDPDALEAIDFEKLEPEVAEFIRLAQADQVIGRHVSDFSQLWELSNAVKSGTEAFRQGATEAEVMDWVGHRESKMVHHYRHLRPDDSQSRMRKIDFLADDTGSSAD